MQDEDLREQFSEWARELRAAVPPTVSLIRRRAHRRTARVAAACVTAVAVAAAGGIVAAHDTVPASSRHQSSALPRLGALPAPDAGAGAAPYYVAVDTYGDGAGVWDAATGKELASIAAPADRPRWPLRHDFTSIAAAGDDRTFVLGAIANTNSEQASPVWFFELRLATGATRTWTSTPQDIGSLSWAGDGTLAYACGGVCLLGTTVPGHELSQSRLVIPSSTRYHGLQTLQWPMITPDGSAIYVAMENIPGDIGLIEFSARTGRPLRVVIQPRLGGPFPAGFETPPWPANGRAKQVSYLDPELSEFLTARLDEAEAIALAAGNGEAAGEWTATGHDSGGAVSVRNGEGHMVVTAESAHADAEAGHIARNDPAAALRSIAADRWLVAEFGYCQGDVGWDEALALAARCRAMTWSTHPDYQDRWKPENLRACRVPRASVARGWASFTCRVPRRAR